MIRARIIMSLLTVLVTAGACSENLGKKVAEGFVPPSKPSPPEVEDPYQQEADLLTKELDGIRFLAAIAEENEKNFFLKSSQDLRQRLSTDQQLSARLKAKMPAEIWLKPGEPNYSFVNFNSDIIQPFIHIGSFSSSEDLVAFIDSFPDRSLPEISKRIENQKIVDKASFGAGDFKVNISVGGTLLSEAVLRIKKIEDVLFALTEADVNKIRSISLTSFANKAEMVGSQLVIELNVNSSAHDWFIFIKSALN